MEIKDILREALSYPSKAAFSRIRYVATLMTEEEQTEFIKGLFIAAVEAREAGTLDDLLDYLERWEEKGVALAGSRAQAPEVGSVPWTPLHIPINRAKFALVTTGGFYIGGQEPFETDGPEGLGDWSFRSIPKDTPRDDIKIAHTHYDISGPREDINCVFPLDRFIELEQEGLIGRLADTNYSFMGFIQRPDLLMSETAPQVAQYLKADGVDAVFLTST